MGTPKDWITCTVRTDGFEFRPADLPGETQYHPGKPGNPEQVATQARDDVVLGGR